MSNLVAAVPGPSQSWLQRGDLAESWFGAPASMDFCEDNYAVTHHVTEFFNSVSSLGIVLLGIVGLLFCNPRNEKRLIACYVGVICVGFGSVMFHGTLRNKTQASDEISMLWTNVACIWNAVFFRTRNASASSEVRWAVGLGVVGLLKTLLYVSTWEIYELFIATYGVGVCVITGLTLSAASQVSEANRPMVKMMWMQSLGCYVLALVAWFCENFLCTYLKPYYLHAWLWHGGSCLGVMMWISIAAIIRADTLGEPFRVKRLAGILPVVVYDTAKLE